MQHLIDAWAWSLLYAERLVSDLAPEQWAETVGPGLENHAAWTIGHLVTAADMVAVGAGLPSEVPPGWEELFLRRGPGDPRLPDPEPAAYPDGNELIAELRRQHERAAAAWLDLGPEHWSETVDWAFGTDLPTQLDVATFMAITHEALHLGQLAAWRRALGLPSALRALAVERSEA